MGWPKGWVMVRSGSWILAFLMMLQSVPCLNPYLERAWMRESITGLPQKGYYLKLSLAADLWLRNRV